MYDLLKTLLDRGKAIVADIAKLASDLIGVIGDVLKAAVAFLGKLKK